MEFGGIDVVGVLNTNRPGEFGGVAVAFDGPEVGGVGLFVEEAAALEEQVVDGLEEFGREAGGERIFAAAQAQAADLLADQIAHTLALGNGFSVPEVAEFMAQGAPEGEVFAATAIEASAGGVFTDE